MVEKNKNTENDKLSKKDTLNDDVLCDDDVVTVELQNETSDMYIPLDNIRKHLAKINELTKKVNELTKLNPFSDENDATKKDIQLYKFLREEYGVNIEHLNVHHKHDVFGIKRSTGNKHIKELTKKEIEDALNNNTSALRAARSLGVSYETFKKYARREGIDYVKNYPLKTPNRVDPGKMGRDPSKYTYRKPTTPFKGKYPIQDILAGKYPKYPVHRLKDKLIRADIKKVECEICGFTGRRHKDGKPPLLLLFKDGNYRNHKLDNIKVVCYNCGFMNGAWIHKGDDTFDPDVIQGSKYTQHQRF